MNITTIYAKRYEISALALWLAGVVTTYLFLKAIVDFNGLTLFVVAIVIQLILTTLESFAWTAQQPVARRVGQVVFVGDSLINAAALLPYVARFDNTNVWTTLATYSAFGISEIDGFLSFAIAFVLGAVIAVAPEILFSLAQRGR